MTYEQSRLLKPSTYSWSGDFCFRVWDKTHFCGSVWDRRQRNQRDNTKTGRCFDIVWLWRLLNSSNTQTTVSSLTHISWQADLSMGFRTLLRWTTPLTHLCCSWEKNCRLHSTTVTQRGRLNPPQRFKPQQIHTDAPTEAVKHIFQQRPLNVLWPGSEPHHLCVHTYREAVLQHVEETDWRDSGKSEGLEETLDSCRVSVATSSSQTHLHSHYHGAETSPDTSNTQRHASNAGEFFSSSQPQRQRRSLLSRWGHRW